MPLRIVELYPWLDQIHLYKDPGAVLHELVKEGAHGELLVTPKRLNKKGFLPKIVWIKKPFFWRTLAWLWSHSKEFDVLFMFHTHPLNLIYGPLFKLRNPRGINYIKADMDNTILSLSRITPKNLVRRCKIWLNLAMCDVMSIEQVSILRLIGSRYKRFAKKLYHMPNGYGGGPGTRRPFAKKENLILCVGFVGSPQKATDIILKTIPRLDLGNWNVAFAGKIVPGYESEINAFFARHPRLKKHVKFHGHITERKMMLDLYSRAKIFLMPSRYEGFSIAPLEAAYFGCVIVGTPVGGVAELAAKGGAICPIEDVDCLVRELQKRMRNPQLLAKESASTRKLCEKEFMWKQLVRGLQKRFNQCLSRFS